MSNGTSNHIELSTKAKRDLRKMPKPIRDQIKRTLKRFALGHANVDITRITDQPPFFRLRSGDYRIVLRPLTEPERQWVVMRRGRLDGANAYLVARVIDRAELERAKATLIYCELDD